MKFLRNSLCLLFVLSFFAACSGSSSTGSSPPTYDVSNDTNLIGAYSDPESIAISGASSDDCQVIGSLERVLGEGTPSEVIYTFGLEQKLIAQCGDLSALFSPGDDSVTLSQESTVLANQVLGTNLDSGTSLIVALIEDLEAEFTDEAVNQLPPSLMKKVEDDDSGDVVSEALLDFIAARDALTQPLTTAQRKLNVIKLLVNSGEAVLIENVGAGQTLTACDNASVAGYSANAVAEDASSIGLTGCLVYHSLDAVTDLNNPAGAPASNVPSSFRSLADESGVVQELIDSYTDNRVFTLADVHEFLYSIIGYEAYSQDDEGVTTAETVAESGLSDFFSSLLDEPLTAVETFTAERFHTGYNPSGGWEVNVAAELQDMTQHCAFNDEKEWVCPCQDSDRDTECDVDPLHFDFDGTTLTENTSGAYILRLTYSDGAYLDEAAVLNVNTGKPYRDSNYHVVTVDIDADDYSAIDYANPLYRSGLDPMEDAEGDSAPYSSAVWRALYPDMSNVDNAYRFGTPEVAVRLALLLNTNQNLSRLSSFQAYALAKMVARGMVAVPLSDGTEALFVDHDKTLSEWENLATTWLQTGSSVAQANGGGKLSIKRGEVTISEKVCWTSSEEEECALTSTLEIDISSKTSVSNGSQYDVSGSVTVTTPSFGTAMFSPTTLLIAPDGNSAQFLGDSNLVMSFSGTHTVTKIDGPSQNHFTYSFKALSD